MELLDPTNDYVFKRLLRDEADEKRRIAMLTAVLQPRVPIVSATVLNPEIPPEAIAAKAIVLDVHVLLDDGRRANVEMEALPRAVYIPRSVFYWARRYVEQLGAGEDYGRLRQAVSVTWLGASLPAAIRGSVPPRARYRILEAATHDPLTDHLDMHFLDLPRLVDDASAPRELRRWARLLHHPSEETLRRLADEDETMADTIDKLRALSADAEARRLAQLRADSAFFARMERELEREEGRAEGEAIGVAKGEAIGIARSRREMAQRLLRLGVDRAAVREATELTDAELDELVR